MDRQTETDGRGVPGGLQDAGLSHCWGLGLQLGAPVCAPPPRPPPPPSPPSRCLYLFCDVVFVLGGIP